jgi:hypothetical protein
VAGAWCGTDVILGWEPQLTGRESFDWGKAPGNAGPFPSKSSQDRRPRAAEGHSRMRASSGVHWNVGMASDWVQKRPIGRCHLERMYRAWTWPEQGDPEKFTMSSSQCLYMEAVHRGSPIVASLAAIDDDEMSLSLSHQMWSSLH